MLFEIQSAQRYYQTCLINGLHKRIFTPEIFANSPHDNMSVDNEAVDNETVDNNSNDDISAAGEDFIVEGTGQATFGRITTTKLPDDTVHYELAWKTKSDLTKMGLKKDLIRYIGTMFGDNVSICTEYT